MIKINKTIKIIRERRAVRAYKDKSIGKEKIKVYENDSNNSLREFATVVELCDVIVAGDTLALHMGIVMKKKVVALFFCTPPWEIEEYGLVSKIVSPLLKEHFFDDVFNEELANSIKPRQVVDEIKKIIK